MSDSSIIAILETSHPELHLLKPSMKIIRVEYLIKQSLMLNSGEM